MSYKSMDNRDYEIDELNIKSHLNTSLGKSGINVSEDLIQRTLDAINKETDIHKKPIKASSNLKYIRNIAGIAAALLVVVGGLNVLNVLGDKGMTKDNAKENAPDMLISADMTDDTTANDSSDMYTCFGIEEDNMIYNEENAKFTDSGKESTERTLTDDSMIQKKSELIDDGDTGLMATAGIHYGFREIAPVDIEGVEYIKITDNESGASITLNDTESIKEFYNLMQPLEFTETSLTDEDTLLYLIEIKEHTTYTLELGSMVIISSEEEDTATDDLFYTISDGEIITKILSTYFH
ncbi:MAG: hypothetical protein GX288_09990 [Clostridiales bacterium]|nr:hypothetical protein [Clostridiales bacterium]